MRGLVRSTLGLLLLCLAACTDSAAPVETGTVTGTVTDAVTGQPIASATITAAAKTAQSASDGSFSIGQVPVGRQRITASIAGYLTIADSISVTSASPVVVNLALHAEVLPAPTGLTAVAGSASGSVVITWNPVVGATSYSIYWGVTADPMHDGSKIPGAASPYMQQGLSGGTPRYYAVTASSALGESAPSAAVTFVPTSSIEIVIANSLPPMSHPIGPLPNGLVDSTVTLAVEVHSQFSIASVVAHTGAVASPMALAPTSTWWRTTLDLLTLPSPSVQQFWVTATDVHGDTASLSFPVRYDRPPVVTVTSPTNGSVATPLILLQASCADDGPGGCKALTAEAGNGTTSALLATGQSTIDQTVSLSSLDGSSARVYVRGTDAADQATTVIRTVLVESSTHLVAVATAGHGIVVDASADRLLAIDSTTPLDSVRIVDRASGTSTLALVLSTVDFGEIAAANLTPVGAIVMATSDAAHFNKLYEWRNGASNQPAGNNQVSGLQVNDNFALWSETAVLTRRDLSSGSNIVVNSSAGEGSNSVAANGDVAFWSSDFNIWYYHAGASTQLTSDGGPSVRNINPVTDGIHVAFGRTPPAGTFQTVLYEPTGNIVLSTAAAGQPVNDYRLNNGWVGFTRYDDGGIRQAWIRSPAGVETQLSFFGNLGFPYGARIQALSAAGEVVFLANGRRYRASAGGSAAEIGSMLGVPLYIDDELYVALGASLFRVN